MAGRVWTEEERDLQSKRAIKQMSGPAMREKIAKGVSGTVRRRYVEDSGFGFLATKGKPNAFLGKTHTEEAKQANREAHLGSSGFVGSHSEETKRQMSESKKLLWQDPKFARRMVEAQHRRPNESELQLQLVLGEYFPGEWKYVGDGQVWIGGRNPDFININGRKQIIEMFGIYWHDEDEVAPLVEHYKKFGFNCLVIWEHVVWDKHRVRELVDANLCQGGS